MNDPLIPPVEWVENPSNDEYDVSCPSCSALVEDRAVHRAFHIALAERADSYVHPPTYGGGGIK